MAVRVQRFSEDWGVRWASYTESNACATLAHAKQWLSVVSASLGHEDRSLLAEVDGEVCGILPMMLLKHWFFGTFHVSLPWLDYGGVVADNLETARALIDEAVVQAREDEVSFIEFRSMEIVDPEFPTRDDKVTLVLELGTAERAWKRLDPKVRNQVRKAQKAGLTCQFGREELLLEFYRVFAQNMRDLGTPVWGIALFEKILEDFPKTSEVALIRLGDKTVGGGLVLSFKNTVYMPSASSLREYFTLCPNNLLYWEVIKRACEAGYRTFDFGRSTPGSGTYHFKKQWGAAVKPLRWQYILLDGQKIPQLNPSNPKFTLLIELWKRLPLVISNRVGPRIVRHLP